MNGATDDASDWASRLVAIASADPQDDGAHDIHHLHRVWKTAQILLEDHPHADALVVQAACYLHDIVNLPKNHPQRARFTARRSTRLRNTARCRFSRRSAAAGNACHRGAQFLRRDHTHHR